jgi:integrase
VVDVFGADTPVENIRRADFDRLVEKLKKRKTPGGGRLSPGTINRYLAVGSAVLAYAQAHDYIVGAPKVPWQQEAGHRIHWLTSEAEEAVHAAIVAEGRADEALALRVLTATGMRWSEFATLTEGQIDGEWIKLNKTKTNTPRDVPIEPALARALREMVRRRGVPQYYTFRKTLKRALKSAGQSEELSVHCLRHTTATRLVHGAVNLSVVKDFLGHASLSTTLKYTHVSKGLLQQARKKISPRAGQMAQTDPLALEQAIQKVTENAHETPSTPAIEFGLTDW